MSDLVPTSSRTAARLRPDLVPIMNRPGRRNTKPAGHSPNDFVPILETTSSRPDEPSRDEVTPHLTSTPLDRLTSSHLVPDEVGTKCQRPRPSSHSFRWDEDERRATTHHTHPSNTHRKTHRMTATDLAPAVATHMTTHFPHDTALGGWEVARNTTNHTAIVIWQPHRTTLTTPAIRGQLLTRWLDHLRQAGFIGEARTDHSIFDTTRQPDGYACWLHITGQTNQAAAA